ncbi:hypothetical protein D3C73_1073240 [compost metagenome]
MVSDQDVNAGARGDAGQHVINQRRDATANQWGDDNRQRSTDSGIAVATGCAAQHTVGAGQHVDVEVRIHFQCAQHYDIQTVNRCAFRTPVSVLVSADLNMVWIAGQGFCGGTVEALYIQQFAD